MKQNFKLFAALAASAAMMFSCQQAEDPTMDKAQEPIVKTRAYGDKTPKVTIYVETNDVNPLNAGDYMLSDGTAYADIVEFFAANLNKETVNGVVRPTLYLNDKMTNLLENGGAATYVAGLQAKGIKVVLTILPNWQNIDFTSLNDTQADQLATILAYAVNKYPLPVQYRRFQPNQRNGRCQTRLCLFRFCVLQHQHQCCRRNQGALCPDVDQSG